MLAAASPIRPLAWEFPYAMGVALRKKKKERKEGRKKEGKRKENRENTNKMKEEK